MNNIYSRVCVCIHKIYLTMWQLFGSYFRLHFAKHKLIQFFYIFCNVYAPSFLLLLFVRQLSDGHVMCAQWRLTCSVSYTIHNHKMRMKTIYKFNKIQKKRNTYTHLRYSWFRLLPWLFKCFVCYCAIQYSPFNCGGKQL